MELKEQLWKGDADLYQENLTVAAPVGVLTREETLETIAAGPRWAQVSFDDARVVALDELAVVLTYRASARRAGAEGRYTARASSAYVRREGWWKLAFHQQTPSPKRA